MKYYLAVDIGASSGRHIIAHMENGEMKLEEIYRFENGMVNENGSRLWDLKKLFQEIVNGIAKCKEINKIPVSMSIDTWAVDYVLLDENDNVLGKTFGYRDSRTEGMDEEVYKIISEKDLYKKTGIQKQIFNTIYQLMAVKTKTPECMNNAKTFLMLPDYFQFLLTGNKVSEYTNATSSQLVDPETKQWNTELIEKLGFKKDIFLPLSTAGTSVGNLTQEIKEKVGFDLEVVACASHDTASAVMAIPKEGNIYISSGTWSLMGVENMSAICDEKSHAANFTNEGGYEYRFRYLKNIMGLWMIQSVRHELDDKYSFAQICAEAETCKDFPSRVDVNDDCFLAPESMIEEVKNYCERTGQKIPESLGEIATVIYQSLAECYGRTVKEIENNTGVVYEGINVIGGGSNAAYLNQLTANETKKTVYAGVPEATAVGNLIAQMVKGEEFKNLVEARECVCRSFETKEFRAI